jgi:general stress protein YciG
MAKRGLGSASKRTRKEVARKGGQASGGNTDNLNNVGNDTI